MSVSHVPGFFPLLGASIDLLCCSSFNHFYQSQYQNFLIALPQEEQCPQLSQRHLPQPGPSRQHRRNLQVSQAFLKTLTWENNIPCPICTCSVILCVTDMILDMCAHRGWKQSEIGSCDLSERDFIWNSLKWGWIRERPWPQWRVYSESHDSSIGKACVRLCFWEG